ncbi:MAG: 3-hydroxyacyl-CoA dehydrogenase [Actinomycetia bacterium]|nr:3-hydroxyacyl-CoA dehydrogenase [Actinomycetes bacterium]MCP4224996.1 3-hydroxyacyl-CoA dehydrogenase [Actinomycetes bacterium]MCP5034624.1 3-hydroxyacyl-CoA dehydrogenase [Actinomycetes bacterium]
MSEPKKVTILGGGGRMGHGIALACLQYSDAEVVIVSRRAETVDHGMELVTNGPFGLERAVTKERITRDQADNALARLTGTTDYEEALTDVDLIFETVPEVVATKHASFELVDRYAPSEAVLATNTSSILIAELAAPLENPSRLVGTHWFYPAHVMPLVEVSRSTFVDDDALEYVLAYLRQVNKRPVVVKDSPGFFMTRFINNYLAEAIRLVELNIAGPAEIDEMVKTGLGWPMGVFELLDGSSFDAFYHAQEYLHANCGERYAVPTIARQAFLAGYHGSPDMVPDSRGGLYDFLGVERAQDKK